MELILAVILFNLPVLAQSQWALDQIDALRAQAIKNPQEEVLVAVIDTGVDLSHPFLRDNLWKNPKEIPFNNKDDDNNGFIDDVYGWNFVQNTNNVSDLHGHGSHISGIIKMVSGAKVKIMTLKYYDSGKLSEKNLNNTIRAIQYAIAMGAQIINYSGGGFEKSVEEEAAIRLASRKNILYVAAAGNERTNLDFNRFYPASYDLPNVLSVAAIEESGGLLSASNYGPHTVRIAAPGRKITSTLPFGRFGEMDGTSQATAFVTGAAALLKSTHPNLKNPQDIIRRLIQTGISNPRLKGKTSNQQELNIFRAIAMEEKGTTAFGQRPQNIPNIPEIFWYAVPFQETMH